MSVILTIHDEATGDDEIVRIPDDTYFLVATGGCYVDNRAAYANGTTVITLRGVLNEVPA